MVKIFYFVGAWTLLGLFIWSIGKTVREGVAYVKKLHQIPCSRCAYFTGDYRLKCTVHPFTALSEEAIECRDFEPTSTPCSKKSVCSQKISYPLEKKFPPLTKGGEGGGFSSQLSKGDLNV